MGFEASRTITYGDDSKFITLYVVVPKDKSDIFGYSLGLKTGKTDRNISLSSFSVSAEMGDNTISFNLDIDLYSDTGKPSIIQASLKYSSPFYKEGEISGTQYVSFYINPVQICFAYALVMIPIGVLGLI